MKRVHAELINAAQFHSTKPTLRQLQEIRNKSKWKILNITFILTKQQLLTARSVMSDIAPEQVLN